MSSTYNRVFSHMNYGKEPKGHCEAVRNRTYNGCKIIDKNYERDVLKHKRLKDNK